MRSRRCTLALAALLASLAAPPARAQDDDGDESADDPPVVTLTLDDYRGRLQQIDALLAAGDRAAAAAEAQTLLEVAVQDEKGGLLYADLYALAPIAQPEQPAHRARLQRLIAALGAPADGGAAPGLDGAELERLRAEQSGRPLEEGGEAKPFELDLHGAMRGVLDSLESGLHWLGRLLERVLRWIFDGPEEAREKRGGGPGLNWLIFGAVGFLLVLLGVLAWRARGTPQQRVSAPKVASATQDEDPLSRSTVEWEERARELAAAGRAREAIRAWYHAVLTACYATGLLHHRRGRTNWEYAADLGAGTPWRPGFLELTRGFDEEWYGRDASTLDALERFRGTASGILRGLREGAR